MIEQEAKKREHDELIKKGKQCKQSCQNKDQEDPQNLFGPSKFFEVKADYLDNKIDNKIETLVRIIQKRDDIDDLFLHMYQDEDEN